jgi:hypothetical protein
MIRLAVIAIVAGLASPAWSQAGHDGLWTVEVNVTRGDCPEGASFPVRVAAGRISYAGNLDLEASGTVGADGRVSGAVRRGRDVLNASGRIAGRSGQGQWVSPSRACAGTWRARRL